AVYGASVVTALTAQDTMAVHAIVDVEPSFVGAQLDAVLGDLPVAAAKTGMLGRAAVVEVVSARLAAHPVPRLVVDPVLVAGARHRMYAVGRDHRRSRRRSLRGRCGCARAPLRAPRARVRAGARSRAPPTEPSGDSRREVTARLRRRRIAPPRGRC